MQKQNNSGQTLIEIMVAIAIITMVLLAVVSRSVEAVRNANFARNQSLATRFAQEGVEWVRIQRDRLRWGGLEAALSLNPAVYCLPVLDQPITGLSIGTACDINLDSDNIPGTIFDRQVTINYFTGAVGEGDYIEIEVSVSWQDSIGTHESLMETRLSEWI